MAYSHFKILQITEDQDMNGKPRIRAQIEDYAPRVFNTNLTKLDTKQIEDIKKLVGGDAMISGREGKTADGVVFYVFDASQPVIPIHQPEKVNVSSFQTLDKKAV